jgi:hypothetical protein
VNKPPIDFARWRAIILQVLALQAQPSATRQQQALVLASKLRHLQRLEDSIARDLCAAGWAPDDAVEDALRFLMHTIDAYERNRAGSSSVPS